MAQSVSKYASPNEVLAWASSKGLTTSEAQLLLMSSVFLVGNDAMALYHQVHVDPGLSLSVFIGTVIYAVVRTLLKLIALWKISLPDNVVAALQALVEAPSPSPQTQPTTQVQAQVQTQPTPTVAPVQPQADSQPANPPIAPFTPSPDVVIE